MAYLGAIGYGVQRSAPFRIGGAHIGKVIGSLSPSAPAMFGKQYVGRWDLPPFKVATNPGALNFKVVITAGGVGVSGAAVTLHERESQQKIERKLTDSGGLVSFDALDKSYKYTVIAIHPSGTILYNASRQDGLVPA